MNSRPIYVTLPRAAFIDYSDGRPSVTADIVLVNDDSGPRPTGLLDASGAPLYRMPETVQIGFVVKPLC